mgnify:CR=1 FL=1
MDRERGFAPATQCVTIRSRFWSRFGPKLETRCSVLPQGNHFFQKRHVFWGLGVKEPSGESFFSKTTRIFATAPFSGHGGFWPCLVYSLVELAAGGVAAGVFKVTQPSEYLYLIHL